MTPKEKAEQLVNDMQSSLYSDGWEDSKQCALIAVNEIIKTICYCYPSKNDEMSFVEYWEEVKKEIEKL